jgi:WD40 repeat protein
MDSRHVIARFEAERQALALMDHPNIARVLDAGTTGSGRPYFVMELVKGMPITQYCDDHHVTPRRRLELFSSVCQAVQHAHQKGIIHRDLKASNVMVALYDGRPVPKIIDFGVAKATGSKLTERTLFTEFGAILGTLEYMSPEQAELNQLDIDTRSDIYSLGVLLYELLTGSTPLERKRIKAIALHEVLRVIREEEPPKPSTRLSSSDALPSIAANRGFEPLKLNRLLQGELDWIVMKALEKDRNRRYDTANSFAADVQRYLADEQVQACPPSAGYRLRKFARRNKVAISTTAVVAAAIVFGIIVSTRQAIRASKAEAQSELRRIIVVNYLHLRASGEYRNARISEGIALLSRVYEEAGPDTALSDSVRRLMLGWSAQSGRPIVHDSAILSAAFSPDGRTILLAGGDRKCTAYNAQTTVPTGRPLEHADSVRAVAFSPNGRIVLTGSQDKTAQLWDCETGIPIGKPLRHGDQIWAVAFSPDGQTVATAGRDHEARLWNAATGVSLGPPLTHPQNVLSVSFSPSGQQLLTGCIDGTARIWDVRTKAITKGAIRIGAPIYAVAFSPDGRKILTGSANRSAQLWDAQTLRPVGTLQHENAVYAVAWSPDGREILTGSFDKTARLWNAETHQPIGEPLRHGEWVMTVAFSPDGRTVLTGGSDRMARLWDVRPKGVSIINEDAKARAILRDPLIVCTEVALRTMQLVNPQAAATLICCPSLNILATSRDGLTLLVRQSAVAAQIWDRKKEKPHGELIHHDSNIWAAAFSADGRTLLTGGQDQNLRLWNVESGKPIRPPIRHGGIVKAVTFSQSGKWMLSGSSDATARIWDAHTGSPKGEPMQHPSEVNKVAFSPDDRLALTVCSDGSAR